VLNAVLFSLYHFWTPPIFSRVLVVLPWAYIAQRKRNIAGRGALYEQSARPAVLFATIL
jgi:hypothetical protein